MKLILAVDAIRAPLTGIGRYAWELASRIPAQPGVEEVRFFSGGRWISDPASQFDQSPLKLAARRSMLRNRVAVAAYRMLAPTLLRRRLRQCRDFVFHGTNYYLPHFPGPAIATIHDLSVFRCPQFHPPERVSFMSKEIPTALARASFLVTDSEFVRREVIERFGWAEDRIRAIPLGVRADLYPRGAAETAAVLGKHGLQHGAYALCVATIEPRKNIGALLNAFGALPSALRRRFPLVLAGDRGWLSEPIHRQIERGCSAGWLRYLSYVPDAELSMLYAGARGFAFPSLYEGFGLPLLEAMASGLPVLTTRDSTMSEVASGAALLVDPADDAALVEGIRVLLEDDVWRSAAIPRSLATAAKYTWDETARRTVDVYRTVSQRNA